MAETLITLVIIGVVAALTVPTLINKAQNQEFVSKLKKTYSTFSQATNKIIAEKGSITSWDLSDSADLYELYKKHLISAKLCGPNSGCFEQISANNHIKYLNGDDFPHTWNSAVAGWQRLILSDGVQVLIQKQNNTCTQNTLCAQIFVDVNGAKKPNKWGRDIFRFFLYGNTFIPAECSSDDCNINSHGVSCACKVLREGAMNY